MKIAVTFFRKKRKKQKIRNSYISIDTSNSINIKKYEILIVLFSSIFMVLNSTELVYLGSNIIEVKNIDVSKEKIMSLNSFL